MQFSLIKFFDLTPVEQASWVQAIFSIVAIAVAIAVPYCTERQRRERQQHGAKQNARSVALIIMDDTNRLLNMVNTTLYEARGDLATERLDAISKKLEVPEQLSTLAPRLHELGPAGVHVQNAIVLVHRAKQEMMEEELRLHSTADDQGTEGALSQLPSRDFSRTLKRAGEELESAGNEIQKLFPGLAT